MQPFDAGTDRMANLQDPEGVKFCITQSIRDPEPVRLGEANAFCWGELATRNVEGAKAFYSCLFGWNIVPFDQGPMPYNVINLANGQTGIGGIFPMPEEMPGEAGWLPYFMVDDCAQMLERARSLGASVLHNAMDIPTVGSISTLTDPQGAMFAIIQPDPGNPNV